MKIDYSANKTASKGRNGDKYIAHIAEGETIVPPVISDELRSLLHEEMIAAGINPDEYTVGNERVSINPETGLPEFGFLSKIFKTVKKVVKKAAPILSIAAPLALGPAGLGLTGSSLLGASALTGGGIGALSGNGLKGVVGGALSGAGGAGLGGVVGKGLGLSGLTANTVGSGLVGAASGAISGGDLKSAALGGGLSGLSAAYQSGAFNNIGKAFNDSGISGALSQVGDNFAGKGDILGSTSGVTANSGGGGSSSYGTSTQPSSADLLAAPTTNPSLTQSIGDNLFSGRGINSLLSAGINTYSNNKAAEQLLKQQKQGLSALAPYLNHQFNPTDLQNDPGYQFQLQQGTKALDAASAARGNYFSGDALRSAGAYATGLADQTYNQAFQRDQTQNNANIQGILSKYGILADIGNTKAANTIGNADAITSSLANLFQPEDPYAALLKKYLGA